MDCTLRFCSLHKYVYHTCTYKHTHCQFMHKCTHTDHSTLMHSLGMRLTQMHTHTCTASEEGGCDRIHSMAVVISFPHVSSASSECSRENPISHSCWRKWGSTRGAAIGGAGELLAPGAPPLAAALGLGSLPALSSTNLASITYEGKE